MAHSKGTNMPDRHVADAVSFANILLKSRAQFADAIRAAAIARIGATAAESEFAGEEAIPRSAIEPHVDNAIDAIGRDGFNDLEEHIRIAIDGVVREALVAPGARASSQ
jgi:hypothetical protein